MRTMTKDVKSQSVTVAEAEFPVYDSVAEAIEHEGENTVLSLVNSQIQTNTCNRARADATGKPSKEQLRLEAISRITNEEFQAASGDKARINELISGKMAEIEREQAQAQTQGEGVPPDAIDAPAE